MWVSYFGGMKTKSFLRLLAVGLVLTISACGGGTSEADEARMDKLDSLETDIDHAIQTLEEKSSALERSLDELDTTTVYK